MKNKILLITGKGGQVASEYEKSQPLDGWDFSFFDRQSLDITNSRKVSSVLKTVKPDAVLNLAAYTNVEKAEKEETTKSFNANTTGPKVLAKAAKELGIPLIHISTDYVFDGSKDFYTETDIENPINQYGRTKFLGEKMIQESHDWYYILRTSWVYSNESKNFYTTMLSLAQERNELLVVDDQFGSPTSAKEICRAIDSILRNLQKENTGIYHFTGKGKTSWKDFATEIFHQSLVNVEVKGVSTSYWPSKVVRPTNSYLISDKFSKTFGYSPMHWKNALTEVVNSTKYSPIKVGDSVIFDKVKHVIVSTDWLKRIARISSADNINKSIEISFDLLSL